MEDLSASLEVVGLLHDSVLDEDRWNEALDAMTRYTGGHASALVAANPAAGVMTQCDTRGVDPGFTTAYVGHYATCEVRLAPALRHPVGHVLVEEMLVERCEYRQSEIYNDLLVKYEVPHHMFAWLRKTPTEVATVAIQGTLGHGAFGEAAYLDTVERLPFGVALLNLNGRVLELDSAFRALMSRSMAIAVRSGPAPATPSRRSPRRWCSRSSATPTPAVRR